MICKGKGCNNNVEEGWCAICQLRWSCMDSGYEITGQLKDNKIYGLILTRSDLVR